MKPAARLSESEDFSPDRPCGLTCNYTVTRGGTKRDISQGTCGYSNSTGLSSVVDSDPHHFGNLDPHQIKIRIRIKIYELDPEPDPDPHQFADVKPKCMEY